MDVLGRGILFGLVLAVMLGPIFIVIINTSLQYGRKAGLIASLGVWLSDLIYISLSYFFINQVADLVENPNFKFWMAIIGGSILIAFGMYNCLKRVEFTKGDLVEKLEKPYNENRVAFAQKKIQKSKKEFFLSGFLVNTINPFTLFFWLTVMTTEVIGNSLTPKDTFLFIVGVFSTIVCTDGIKVLGAGYIRNKINHKIVTIFVRVAGIGLVVFGLYFLYYGVTI